MPHYTPLISTIVVALVLAFIFGVIAQRLRFSPLVGYLVAGILISRSRPDLSPTRASQTSSPRSAWCC